jgi:PQQ-like domain
VRNVFRKLTPSRLILLLAAIALVALLAPGSPFEPRAAHAQNAAVATKGIQTGSVVFGTATGSGRINAATTNVTLGLTVDATKSFVHCTFATAQADTTGRPTCELASNGTTVTITIGALMGGANTTTVHWYVAEFEGDVLVQRGLASFATGDTQPGGAVVTLPTAVTCTKSFVLTTERMNNTNTNQDERWQATATLGTYASPCTSGTTTSLELQRIETGTAMTVAWQVIQIDGLSVQRGTTCIGKTVDGAACTTSGGTQAQSTTKTVTSVTTTRAFVLTTQRAGTNVAGSEGLYRVRTDVTNATTLTFTRGIQANGGAGDNGKNILLTYELVSFLDSQASVQRSTVTLANGVATGTASLTAVTQARTIPFFSSSHSVDSGAQHSSAMMTAQVRTATSIDYVRSATTNAETVISQAVQFFGCDTDPTLCHVSASVLNGTTATSASVKLAWWPSYYASGFRCYVASATSSTPVQGPICNVMVVRTADGSTPSPTLVNGTNITGAAGTLVGGGSCTRTGATAGTSSNPCIVFNQSSTGATTQTATDNFHSGGSGLNDGTTYTYRVYVKGGTTSGCASWPCWVTLSTTLSQVAVTARQYSASTGGMQWAYAASGGATLNSPIEDFGSAGLGARVFANSSNHKFLSIDTNTGSELSLPVTTPGAGLGYASWWPPNPPGTRASQVVIGDQKGYVTSFDGTTGKRIWTRKIHTDPSDVSGNADIDTAVSVQMRRYSNAAFTTAYPLVGGETSYDVVFAATKNATVGGFNQNNKIYALKSTDGTLLWTFDPNNTSVCNPAKPMDVVSTQVAVDYERNRLIVTTEDGFSTAQNSLWIISSLGPTTSGGTANCNGMLVASFGSLRDIDTTVWQNYDGSTFYFQNSDCALFSRDSLNGSTGISDSTVVSANTSDAAPGCLIKSSVWQDYNKYLAGQTRLYFVTQNGGIWCVDEITGVDFDLCTDWSINPVYIHSGPTLNGNSSGATKLGAPMLLEPHFWAGGQSGGTLDFGQGVLFQINTANGTLEKTFTVDSGNNLGDLSTSSTADALYVGSSAGRLYRINLGGVYGSLP